MIAARHLIASALAAAAAGGCTTDAAAPDAAGSTMALGALAGSWTSMMTSTTATTCPWAPPPATGWRLRIDPIDPERATVETCVEQAGIVACDGKGPLIVVGDLGMVSTVSRWSVPPHDCTITSVSAGVLRQAGPDLLGLEITTDSVELAGPSCDALERDLQTASGRDQPVLGCRVEQTVVLIR